MATYIDVSSWFISARGAVGDDAMKTMKAYVVVDKVFSVHLNHISRHGVIVAITLADILPI